LHHLVEDFEFVLSAVIALLWSWLLFHLFITKPGDTRFTTLCCKRGPIL